ncbi:MAG TPA: copper chaperone [Ignavibacteria bacterium]|nr:copper chaperone [Ignavibacteria bacterium]
MKALNKSFVLFLSLLMLSVINISAQEEVVKITTEFKVFGNCGMCEERIEKVLMVDGVESASWDKETKMATVVYVKGKVTEDQLHKNVAEVGHDTEKYKASDEVYSKLPGCCKFDRTEDVKKENDHKDHKHSDSHDTHHKGDKKKSCCK